MKFGATNKPGTCKWCGRKLTWVCDTVYKDTGEAPRRCTAIVKQGIYGEEGEHRCESTTFTDTDSSWVCEEGHHNSSRRKIVSRTRRYKAPGAYGDGHFCGQSCGYNFGVALANAGRLLQPKKD